MCANLGIQLILIYYREKKERNGEEEMERMRELRFLKQFRYTSRSIWIMPAVFDNVCIASGVGLKSCRPQKRTQTSDSCFPR